MFPVPAGRFCRSRSDACRGWVGNAVLLLVFAASAAVAQTAEDVRGNRVLARVNGQPITAAELQYELKHILGDREWDDDTRQLLRSTTLEQLIQRRLALRYLQQQGLAASEQEVDLVLQREVKAAEARGGSRETLLAGTGLSLDAYRSRLAWQIGWQRFLEQHLNDENRQRYFQQHRAEFDGTQIQVAQILLAVDPADDPAALTAALAKAQMLRQQIEAGELTFAEAARRHSQAPTAKAGGDIGYIHRHHPMPESFSRAAYQLREGQVSPPVTTAFGVHLIRRGAAKPGDTRWEDVREQLDQAMSRHLFQWAANQVRPGASIENLSSENR